MTPIWTLDFESEPIGPRPLHYPPKPVGLAVRTVDGEQWYLSWGHPSGNNCTQEDAARLLRAIWDNGRPIVFHNSKFDLSICYEVFGLPVLPWDRVHDTMFLAFLLDPYSRTLGLKQLAATWLGMPPDERDAVADWILDHKAQMPRFEWMVKPDGKPVTPTKSNAGAWIAYAPGELVGPYALGDVDRTWRLFQIMLPAVLQSGMGDAYDVERRLLPHVMENERTGLRVDLARLEREVAEYRRWFQMVEGWLRWRLNAPGLNLDADQDVADYLESLGIVTAFGKTKTGKRSVAKDALTPDMFTDPQVASVLGYRNRLKTCLSMFMEPWLRQAREWPDGEGVGRISCEWNMVSNPDGGTRCMPAGQLIQTSRGYIPIEDARVGDLVLSHTGEPRMVVAAFANGVKPCYRVTLQNGLSLVTTGNHLFQTRTDWVAAENLTPDHLVRVASMQEVWRAVPTWDGQFEVSSWGRVRNAKTGRVRRLNRKGAWGHLKVTLKAGGRKEDHAVHRLVVAAFSGLTAGLEVRHINGIAWDNALENLTEGTSVENKEDAKAHGTMWPRNYKETKLSEEAAARIRTLPVAERGGGGGPTNAQLAAEYGVCERLIRAVRSGQRWPGVPPAARKGHFWFSRVAKVEQVVPQMTYGVEVADDHSHVTGGIVTHNTGRPSTRNHNFLNISKDFDDKGDGYEHPAFLEGLPPLPLVRRYIVADEGCVINGRDFSGQEMRVFGHYENGELQARYIADPNLDVHAFVGENIAQMTGQDLGRGKVKVLNFQALYGGGVPAAQAKLRCTYDEAKRYKTFHDAALPGRKVLADQLSFIVRTGGAIRTYGGRRYVRPPAKKQKDGRMGDADYILINYLIQGSSADVTKRALLTMLEDPEFASRWMLNVYDELVISSPAEIGDQQSLVMKRAMEGVPLRVKLLTDAEQGHDWGDMIERADL